MLTIGAVSTMVHAPREGVAPTACVALRRCKLRLVALAVLLLALGLWPKVGAAAAFGLEDVAKKAQELAAGGFEDPRGKVPDWLLQIDYDQWRDIRFRPDSAPWSRQSAGFQVQFFRTGRS